MKKEDIIVKIAETIAVLSTGIIIGIIIAYNYQN